MNATQYAPTPVTVRPTERQPLFPAPVEAPRPISQPRPLTGNVPLERILADNPYLPAQTAVLGICDDLLPVLFDLNDPTPGSLLITGDAGCGKTALMKSIVRSSMALNSPYEVQYSLITTNPDEWMEYTSNREDGHCFASSPFYEDHAGRIIIRMAEIAEQRKTGREMGPAHILIIDDLRFMAKADFDVRVNFEWLLKHGPEQHVWPVVSLETEQALSMARMVSYFRTRLIGHTRSSQQKRLTLFGGLEPEKLQTGKQFAVRVQDVWLSFALPAV